MGLVGFPLAKNKIILSIKKFAICSNNLNTLKSIGLLLKVKPSGCLKRLLGTDLNILSLSVSFKGKAFWLPLKIARPPIHCCSLKRKEQS